MLTGNGLVFTGNCLYRVTLAGNVSYLIMVALADWYILQYSSNWKNFPVLRFELQHYWLDLKLRRDLWTTKVSGNEYRIHAGDSVVLLQQARVVFSV